MKSESGETRLSTRPNGGGAPGVSPPPTAEQEQLPCPRCASTNTKFCYYNNYNFSQPRHFCKSCRRYWTRGGTLRDIPVGGGTRKSAKRSRTSSTPPSSSNTTFVVTSAAGSRPLPLHATPVFLPGSAVQFGGGDVKGSAVSLCGSFTSLLNSNGVSAANTVTGPGGFGLGIGSGFDEVGFGFGRAIWPFSGTGDGAAGVGSDGGHAVPMPNTWQLESIENGTGFVSAGECFTWSDLAISTPGNTHK